MNDIKFEYPDFNDPVLEDLRAYAGLKDLSNNGFEKALQICGYAHGLFDHDGDNVPSSFDALTILKEAKAGQSFRCVEYSILGQGLLWAYGIPARVVGLKTADVETREYGAGHVVVEFWHNAKTKWIMCDVQWGIVPKMGGEYLSAVELGESLNQNKKVEWQKMPSYSSDERQTDYAEWIQEYLYFYDTDLQVFHKAPYTDLRGAQKLMLVPRNVKPPKVFQNSFIMNLIYTQSKEDFYQAPEFQENA